MNTSKVVGYRKFNSKAGKLFCILQTEYPFTDREIEYGACGNKIEEVWLPENLHNAVNPQIVGKNVEFDYQIANGRAYVCDMRIK